MKIWSMTGKCREEGAGLLEEVGEVLLDSLQGSDLRLKLSCLSAAAYLGRTLDVSASTELLQQMLQTLRRSHGLSGLPRKADSFMDRTNAISLQLDTDGWLEWGPLQAQVDASKADGVVPLPTVTEKYVQLLAWCSALILAHEGNVPLPQLLNSLDGSFPKGTKIKFGLGQALQFANVVARMATPSSDWGRSLQDTWLEKDFLQESGYEEFTDIPQERNELSHYRNLTADEAQDILNKHSSLIRCLTEPLRMMDVEIDSAERCLASIDDLKAAVLQDSRGNEMNCGPLLLVHETRSSVYYVPHHLERACLKGQEFSEKSTYRRYGSFLGGDARASINIGWEPSDTTFWRKR